MFSYRLCKYLAADLLVTDKWMFNIMRNSPAFSKVLAPLHTLTGGVGRFQGPHTFLNTWCWNLKNHLSHSSGCGKVLIVVCIGMSPALMISALKHLIKRWNMKFILSIHRSFVLRGLFKSFAHFESWDTLHTTKLTILKGALQWLLLCSLCCTTIPTNSKTFLSLQKETLYLFFKNFFNVYLFLRERERA